MKTTVEIEWDVPEEQLWLCVDNIAIALSLHCKNTKFKVKEVSTCECKTINMELKKFELGKCYRHNGGKEMYICGVADTVLYGTAYIAEESGSQNLKPVSMNSKNSAVNWVEISKKEFIKNNFS